MIYCIAIGAVALLLIVWIISVHRSIVAMDENINNAISQIDVQLASSWDVLTSLLDLAKGYVTLEYETLTHIVQARQSITKDSTPEDISKQEYIIAEALEQIMEVAESYPDLKENTTFIKNLDGVKQYEKMIHTSQLIYNHSVTKLNCYICRFPVFLIAGALGFRKRAYLETGNRNHSL